MTEKMTITEAVESLTGFEEIAVTKHFGGDISDLTATMMTRALAFVVKTRESGDPVASKNDVMKSTLKDIQALFAEDDEKDPKA